MNSFYTRDDSLALLSARGPRRRRAVRLRPAQGAEAARRRAEPGRVAGRPVPRVVPARPRRHLHGAADLGDARRAARARLPLRVHVELRQPRRRARPADPRLVRGAREMPYAAEVTERTEADNKGGHLGRSQGDGGLVLRETAQTPDEDLDAFTDSSAIRTSTSTTCGSTCARSTTLLRERDGVLGLPMIVNEKTVDPADPSSPAVFQLETAMGAAIGVFEGARAIRVPRSRFVPVKKTTDLLVLRSDAYVLGDGGARSSWRRRARRGAARRPRRRHFKLLRDFDARFPAGPPSLREAERLAVEGDVPFGRDVVVRGDVAVVPGRARSRTARCSAGARRSAPRARSSSSDSLSIRANSQASAIPITIDCSSAMIRPATCWSSSARQAPARAGVVVGVVEQARARRRARCRGSRRAASCSPCRRSGPCRRAAAASGSARAGATSTGGRRRRT